MNFLFKRIKNGTRAKGAMRLKKVWQKKFSKNWKVFFYFLKKFFVSEYL